MRHVLRWPASMSPWFVHQFWPLSRASAPLAVAARWHPLFSCACKCVSAQPAASPQRLTGLVLPRMQGAVLLARAMKDYERRGGLKEGFSSAPADCVAYKFYRDVRPELLFSVMVYLWLLCMACVHHVLRCEAAMATSSSAKRDTGSHHKDTYKSFAP